MSLKSKILTGILGLAIFIQFFRIDKTNPPVQAQSDIIRTESVPGDVADILKTSCYDCHSNETNYPWYSNVAPVSWWIKGHIDHAREELNFSEWASFTEKRKNHKFEEIVEKIEEGEMPFPKYLILHPEARLSNLESELLISWAKEHLKVNP
jgi:Haem-binding domain